MSSGCRLLHFAVAVMAMSAVNSQAGDKPDPQLPWRAVGKVTDKDGKPLAGVSVHAHTGYATSIGGGSTTTCADGRYESHFGAGLSVPKGDAVFNVPSLVQVGRAIFKRI